MTMSEPLTANRASAPRTVLAPRRALHGAADPWRHRGLVFLLAAFELRRRYRRPMARVALVLAQPIVLTLIAVTAFGQEEIEGLPYAVYVLSGLIPWQLVQSALVGADAVLSSSERFIPRVHFPSIVVPFAAVGASLVELVPVSLVLLGLVAYWQVPLAGSLTVLPVWMLLAALTALGVALWLLPLRVRHGSLRNVIPFLSIVWLLGSPVLWSAAEIPSGQAVLGMNPLVSVVSGVRSSLFGTTTPPVQTVVVSLGAIAIMLVGGWAYFRTDRLGDLLEFRVVRPGPRQ
jgi:lipopolysaccharide transport system permease protein